MKTNQMEVGGIDWPFGVTITKRLIHSVHDILLSVCPHPPGRKCKRSSKSGLSEGENHLYVTYAETVRPLLVVVGSRAQGSVLLTIFLVTLFISFPGVSDCKESACNAETRVRKIPWRRKWQSTLVFLPGKSHEQRSLAGYSPWGCEESDMTEQLTHTHSTFHQHSLGNTV